MTFSHGSRVCVLTFCDRVPSFQPNCQSQLQSPWAVCFRFYDLLPNVQNRSTVILHSHVPPKNQTAAYPKMSLKKQSKQKDDFTKPVRSMLIVHLLIRRLIMSLSPYHVTVIHIHSTCPETTQVTPPPPPHTHHITWLSSVVWKFLVNHLLAVWPSLSLIGF